MSMLQKGCKMSQEDILCVLRANPDKFFDSLELGEMFNQDHNTINAFLRRLYKKGEVVYIEKYFNKYKRSRKLYRIKIQ